MKKLLLCSLALLTLSACGGGNSNPGTPSISITPASASLALNSTFPFHVNPSSTSVTWEVGGVKGGNSTVGTIDSSGNYTAPTKIPSGNPVSVTAISNAQSSLTATSIVTLVPVTLSGQYAFSFSGTNVNGSFFIAGSFTSDGAGTITGGIEDINSATKVSPALTLSGTYTIGGDGRGVISFKSAGNTQTLAFVIETGTHAQIIWFDNAANGSGTIDKQDSTAFSANALTGNYAFGFDGVDGNGFALSWVGTFNLASGSVSSGGQSDLNDAGTAPHIFQKTITGGNLIAPDTNGRGTGTIDFAGQGFAYAYYVVSASKLVFIQIDRQDGVVGTAELQTGQNFNSQSLAGNYAFSLGGVNTVGAIAEAGQFNANGNTGVLSGEVTENNNTVITRSMPSGSNQGIVHNGRGTMTLNLTSLSPASFVFYMISTSKAFILETDMTQVASGQLLAQSARPFQASSLTGNFGFQISGIAFFFTAFSSSNAPVDKSGQFLSDGISSIKSGTEDLNLPGQPPFSTAIVSGSSYTVDSTGRGSLTVTTNNGGVASTTYDFYFVSPSQILMIGTDTAQVTVGAGQSQPF